MLRRSLAASAAIGYWLRLPLKDSKRCLMANRRFLTDVESRRIKLQPVRRLQQHNQRWCDEDLLPYKTLLQQDTRSRIIATFHFGDFVFGLNRLLRVDPPDRERIEFTQRVSEDAYFSNMQRAFNDQVTTASQQWPVANPAASGLGKKLQGDALTVVMFCDLPPAFGATARVDFLDRAANFPRGAATLALRYQLPLLPVISYFDKGRHHIAIAPQIETTTRRPLDRKGRVAQLTQQLCNFLEGFVRRYPEQWRFLSALPSYYTAPAKRQGYSTGRSDCE